MEELTGKQLGPYQIVEPLGKGGMAAVYKAYQPNMDRYVALKVLPRHFASDPEFIGRFSQEARVIANLQHPHILPVHDFGESDGYTYLTMRFIEGGTLADWLIDRQPLPLEKIRSIISQVGGALDYAHAQGVVHRDIKPSNILVDRWDNCQLTDFGLAKMVESTSHLTQTGGILGTPAYMSPEQGLGREIDGRSDIYSLGVVLYQMAIGRLPYQAETPMAVVIKHIHDPLPPPRQQNTELPEAIELVILKALAKTPEDRFATAGEMVKTLQNATEQPTMAVPAAPQPPDLIPAAEKTAVIPPPPITTPQSLPEIEETTVLTEQTAELPTPKHKSKRPYLWAGLGIITIIILGFIIANNIRGNNDDPDDSDSIEELLTVMNDALAEDDHEGALTAVDQAIDLAPNNADIHCQRGYILLDLNDLAAAAASFEHCRLLAQEQGITDLQADAMGQNALTRAMMSVIETEDNADAIAIINEALLEPEAPPWLICERGEYNTWYDNQAAIADFEACQNQNPDDEYWPWRAESVSNMIRGDEALTSGDYYVAIEHFQRWADLVPEAPWPYCSIGDAHIAMSEFEQALNAFQQCLERANDDPEMQGIAQSSHAYTSARLALFDGNLDGALEQFTEAIEVTPDNGGLYCERGVIFNELGALDEARADYEMCLELLQDDPDGRTWAEELLQSLETSQ